MRNFIVSTPAGNLRLTASSDARVLISAEWTDTPADSDFSVVSACEPRYPDTATPLQRATWEAMRAIPQGSVVTYSDLAAMAGYPRAVRAVASAVGRNPFPVIIPCHRVVHASRPIARGNYTGGLWRKLALLRAEGISEIISHAD